MLKATKDVTAVVDGRAYTYKKGQKVDGPAKLVAALRAQGAVRETTTKKKESNDD